MRKLSLYFAIFGTSVLGFAASANADSWTLDTTLGPDSAYSISGEGEQDFSNPANYQLNIDTDKLAGKHTTFSFDNSAGTATGSMTIKLPSGNRTLYYTYTQPNDYETVTHGLYQNIAADGSNVQNKTFTINHNDSEQDAGIFYGDYLVVANLPSVFVNSDFVAREYNFDEYSSAGIIFVSRVVLGGIDGDFIGNWSFSGNGSNDTFGGGIQLISLNDNIGTIRGDFINNYVAGAQYEAHGGAIFNDATIGSIESNFIQNHINTEGQTISAGALVRGGAIANNGVIGDISGNFIGNYIWTNNLQAFGGAIYNTSSIGDIEGDFIGNWVYASSPKKLENSNGNAYGGAIYANSDSSFGKIKGDFIGNFVSGTAKSSLDGTSYAFGGAIYTVTSDIESIEGNFIANYVYAPMSNNAAGGAIYTANGISLQDISGEFLGNYVYGKGAYGGAIVNRGNMTLENSALKNNYAKAVGNGTARGGAIWSINTMTLSATDGFDFEIKGNYVENDSGRTYEAIYMASQTIAGANPYVYSNLNLNATNSGTFTIYDNINGAGGYRFFNDGDGTGKVDMYGFIDGTSSFRTNNIDFHYHQLDDELTTTRFNAFNIDSDTSHFYYYIDVDANTEKADMIKSNVTNTGRVILNGINLMGGDWSSLNSNFIAQVLDVPTDAMQLALSPELEDMTNQIISSETVSETDSVQAVTDWSKVFKSREGSVVVRAGLGLATTKTTHDSIGFTISTDTNITETILGEPLVMVAQDTTNPVKTFSTSNPNAVYTLGYIDNTVTEVGNVKGSLTVSGTVNSNNRSTIDLNGRGGFVLQYASPGSANPSATLTLKNLAIVNGYSTNHGVVENAGILNVSNVIFASNTGPSAGAAIKQSTAGGQINYIIDSSFIENHAVSGGGAIAAGYLIGDIINTYFANNSANTAGGAISLECGGIDGIANSIFTGNNASMGGALYVGYHSDMGNIENSVFSSNTASLGGAIYYVNDSETTSFGDIVNTSFLANNATVEGGAIYSSHSLSISANNGSSTFQGNYVGTVDNNQAIYVNNPIATLTFSARNDGVINLHDYVSGASGYNTMITGNSTGRLNWYNDILNSHVQTSGTLTINTANNDLFVYNLLTLYSGSDVNYSIDIDIADRKSDVFKTTNLSTGIITLNSLNYIGGVDWTSASDTFVIQVISNTNTNSTLKLALSSALSNELAAYSTNVVTTSSTSTHEPLVMQADNDWEDQFETSTTTTYTTNTFSREIGLVSTHTTDDSIGVTVTSSSVSSEVVSTEPAGEPLVLVARDDTNQIKTFTTNDPEAVYTLGYVDSAVDGVGPVSGTLTVSGAGSSTLDLNEKKGFELTNAGSALHFNDMVVTGALKSGDGAAVYQTNGTLSITNVAFTQNMASGRGAAIYTATDGTTISADNGRTLFEGNSVGVNDMQAIYVDGAANSLNLQVNNHGTMTFYDYITGTSGYTTSIAGDNTSVFNLYNNILNSRVSTNGGFNFNTANDSVFTYNFLSFNSDDDTQYTIDVNLAEIKSDVFKTNSLSSGVITLADLNYIGGMTFADVNENFVLQIISNTNSQSTLQLALSTGLSNTLSGLHEHSESSNTVTTSDVIAVQADNDWADKFGTNTTSTLTTTVYDKTVGLLTTNTENDSIGVTITNSSVSSSVTAYVSDGEPIVLVAQDTTHPVKTFTTDDPNAVYTLGYVDSNVAGVGGVEGSLTVSGTTSGDNRSTLDLNNKAGFEVLSSSALRLENVDVRNANSANVGAVNNAGTLNVVNSSFYNNTNNVAGGAINSAQNVNITADNGVSTFQGNYVGNTDNKQAIYMSNSSSTLTINAVNGGVVNMHDYVSGENGYATTLTGNETGTINLYNNVLNSVVNATGPVTINTANNDLFTYNLLTLNSSADTNYVIDIDVTQKLADLFETTNFSSGTITLTGFNVIAGDFADVTDPEFKVQIIKNNNMDSTLQLALGTTIPGSEFAIGTAEIEGSPDAIKANTIWTDIYNRNDISRTTYGTLGLATTDTHNDSIGVVVSRTDDEIIKTPLGDTLVLVAADTTNAVKTFTTTDATATYVLGSSHTVAGVGGVEGSLTVSGTTSGDNRSTLDLNNKAGFEVLSTSALRLENVDVRNANSANIGAVNNAGTLNVVNSSFYNNTNNVAGGAINSSQNVNITTDNGVSTFQGNYVGTADNKQAIYMNDASAGLTISAQNGGVVNMHDYVSGENGYSTTLTGNETGTINLYNNVLNSVVNATGPVTINTANNDLFTYNLLTLNSSADTNYVIDIDVNQKLADMFETTNLSSGTITLAGLNVIAGDFADVSDDSFKIQVINNNNADSPLQLALETEISDHEFLINNALIDSVDDEIQTDTDWTDIYNSTDDTRKTYGRISLATTNTENDSIGVVITRDEEDVEQNPMGDTLALVSGAEIGDRNFNTSSADSTYTLSDNIGDTAEGTLSINGVADEEQRSTLDMNSMSGFTLDKETTINLNNVEVVNGNGALINATNSNAKVNLTNVNLVQNQSDEAVISGNANVNITADANTSSFAGNTASNVIYINNADLNLNAQNEGVVVFEDNISGEEYNVNVLGDNSGEVRFNNHVTSIDNFTFDDGAVAALGVNANINADSMTQVTGADNSTLIVDIEVNKAAQTTSAGLIELVGQLSGDYSVIVRPANDDIYDGAYALFLKAPNDTDSSDENFTVTRVYGNPYMWEARRNIKETDEGSMWYLALSGTTPSEVIPDPEPEPRPAITPEVIAAIGLHEAALEQNRSVVRNVKGKVDANRYYCNDCNISYDRYWRGRQLNNLWILAQGEAANVDAPLDMEASIYDVEAGFDIQSDIHNTLGVFASYRKGEYDFSGKGKPYSSPIGSDIDIDSWLAGLYYRYDRNMNWVFATIFGGIQKADIKTDDGVAKFDTEGTQYGASVEVGHSFLLQKNLILDPSLGVYYTQVDFDDATDNVGKKYSWDEINQLQIELGAKLERQYFRGDIYAKPSVIRTITNGDSVFITGMGKVDDTYEDQTLFRIEVGGRYNFNTSTYGYAWANYTVGSEYDAIAAGLGLNYAW